MRSTPRSRSRWWQWFRSFAVFALIAGLLMVGGLGLLLVLTPGVRDLPGRVAARLQAHEARGLGEVLPARLVSAIVATENSRFYSGHGVDARGVVRAFVGVVGGPNQGGATLEQQLAKEIYSPVNSPVNVITDVGLALKISERFNTSTIMRFYLDSAYFGDGAWGANQAAEHYFAETPSQLSWAQASLLAALVQAPSSYDPHGHLTLARSRQTHVLDRLVAVGTLTRAQADAAFNDPFHPAVTFFG